MVLTVKNVTGGYHEQDILKNITFSVHKGEILGILGPNGSGKTTLLKLISGLLPTREGEILLNNQKLSSYTSKELAREMAVLPQSSDSSFTYSVKDIVTLGRYPYQKGLFGTKNNEDDKIIFEAMKQTKVFEFSEKHLHQLSGGEQQRVLLARALAQQPKLLLLDEPTNHLDISFQISLLDSLKDWAKSNSLTVVAILHDLNMASLYCDRVLLLHEGKQVALDEPSNVMQEKQLEDVYEAKLKRKEHPVVPRPLITLLPKSETEEKTEVVNQLTIEQTDDWIFVQSPHKFKTLSSAVLGAGFSWERTFINRHVHKDYNSDQVEEEFKAFLRERDVDGSEAIGMMTAAKLEDAAFIKKNDGNILIFVVVTAGLSNAVDAAKSYHYDKTIAKVGTINTWVFIEGHLTEAAFVQSMMTATEAKAKALQDEEVKDPTSNTIATGTSTDSLLIAATQTGCSFPYAGTITPLGKLIGVTVYEATVEAIQKNKRRMACY